MADNKKARERQFLEEFSINYPEFPAGKIVDSESPDFLIEQGTKIVGIEIVDFIRGQNKGESAERRNEILWKKIANEARSKFEAKFSAPLLVHFFWNNRYILRQSETSQLADSALGIIEKHIPENLFESVHVGSDEFDDILLEKVCHSITVWRVRNEKQSLWSFISSGWTEVQTNEIQYLLDSKNDKVPEYLKSCDTVWLIIVADGRYISSNIDITSAAISNAYNTLFEHVFVYDRISKGVFPLRLQ
jgi:hypothetical protein